MASTTTRESPAGLARATEDGDNGNPAYHSLSSACGLTLHAYRSDHVEGRIERSLEREGVGHANDLIELVRRDRRARERFRRMLAISVTGRFRDPQQFDLLSEKVLPDLLARVRELRVWSAGCSNGLELVSVATLLDRAGALDTARLLGSDVLAENIEIARAGGVDGIPASAAVASRCRWEVRDLITDPPPDARFDLILCRNVAIYFTRETRAKVMAMFAGALTRGGVLMLGRSERLMEPRHYGLEHFADHCYRRAL
jgi:chemotaxis protein methyltransferase CheR